MTTLDQHLRARGITGAEFAALIGVSEASLTRIRRGEQNIPRDLIRRIVEATGGDVSAEALVFDPVHANGPSTEAETAS